MNARQKAKRYKRLYEALSAKSKPPIEFKVEDYKVDTLKFEELLPEQFVMSNTKDYIDDYVKAVMADGFAKELVKHFNEYIDYYIEHLPYEQKCRLCYRIKVVRRNAESEDIW